MLQRAVRRVLEPVYEQGFLECSYGFGPGRGAHQALEALRRGRMELGCLHSELEVYLQDVTGDLSERVTGSDGDDSALNRAWGDPGAMSGGRSSLRSLQFVCLRAQSSSSGLAGFPGRGWSSHGAANEAEKHDGTRRVFVRVMPPLSRVPMFQEDGFARCGAPRSP